MEKYIERIIAAFVCVTVTLSVFSCGNGSKKKNNSETMAELPANVKEYANDGFTLYWIGDNAEPRNNPVSLFTNVTDEIISELNIADGIPASMSSFLIRTKNENLLFDTGMGGLLLPSLEAIGLGADDIDAIFITHLHPDHIGGLVKDGNAVFKNAKLYISNDEYNGTIGADAEKAAGTKAIIDQYADRLVLFNFGDILEEDVKTIEAVGHTTGHTLFQKGNVLLAGDIMHGLALQSVHPECCASFDMDQEKSVEARIRTIEYADSNNLILCGMHFPEGGIADYRK